MPFFVRYKVLLGIAAASMFHIGCEMHGPAEGAANPAVFHAITLHDLFGRPENFADWKNSKGGVVVFMFPDCPIAQRTLPEIREIAGLCQANNLNFAGVVPGDYYSPDSLKLFSEEYGLPFPLLLDPGYKLCRALGATVSPEAFLVDREGNVRYRGQVNNAFFALGRQRKGNMRHYLKNALQLFAQGQPIALSETKPIGCHLYDTDQNENKRL